MSAITNGIHHVPDSANTSTSTSSSPTTSRPPSPVTADSLSAFTAHLQPVPDRFPPPPPGVSQLIVLGSGSSSGVPRAACILTDTITCRTCALAMQGRPEDNRNWRSNPSLLIHYYQPSTSDYRNVQIDAGKTFRETMLRWYPRYGIHGLHALFLSHEHADAAYGLDDLRSLQKFNERTGLPLTPPIPIYLSPHSMQSIEQRFSYLVDRLLSSSTIRRVAQLEWHVRQTGEEVQPAGIDGLSVRLLDVAHGPDYTAWGFSLQGGHVVYISDVSKVTEETDLYLMSLQHDHTAADGSSRHCPSCALDPSTASSASASVASSSPSSSIHLLIIDSLFVERRHPTHFCVSEAVDAVRRYRPHRALLIGLSDDVEYNKVSARLQQLRETEGLIVDLTYDGQSVNVQL